jgi:probable F420-dependent oxidoreductase
MTPIKRMAVTLPAGPNLTDTIERMKWAEDNGYADGWFSDSGAPDTLTQIAALAHHTARLRIGVAVTPVYTRSPSVFAASANVLGQVLPGRFILGLGASSQTIMGRWNGIPLEKPVTRVKETAQLVRTMLKGEKTAFDGETLSSHGYRQTPMDNPPPIYLAALRPKMIEMAAEFGDGVIFNLWPQSALPKMMEHVAIGAKRAGKDPSEVEIVNRSMALVTDDKAAARDRFRAAFGPYYATPVYNAFLAWSGHGDAAGTISEGWAEKNREKTAGAMSDALIDEIALIGTEDEVRDRIRADATGGVHTHIIAPMTTDPAEIRRTFETFTAGNFSFD